MAVYGYKLRTVDQAQGLLQLREVTFQLTPLELRRLATFLEECARDIEDGVLKPLGHSHLEPPLADAQLIVAVGRR
jgi:hypothetical protein